MRAIAHSNEEYCQREHNLFFDNCHSHVAQALSLYEYQGKTNWSAWDIFVMFLTRGRYFNLSSIIKTYLGSLIFYALLVWLIYVKEIN